MASSSKKGRWIIGAVGVMWVVANLPLVLAAGAAATGAWFLINRRLQRLKDTLKRLGFDVHVSNQLYRFRVVARRGDTRVTISGGWRTGGSLTTLTLRLTDPLLPGVRILQGDEPGLRTGCPSFDAEHLVTGSSLRTALAHLGLRGRTAVNQLRRSGATIEHGAVEHELRPADLTTHLIGVTLDAAEALTLRGRTVEEALADNAVTDPEAGVRLANLRQLLLHNPSSQPAMVAAHASLRLPGWGARIEAAAFLAPAAGDLLMEAMTQVGVTEEERVRALEVILAHYPPEMALAAVTAGLRSTHRAVRVAALVRAAGLSKERLQPLLLELILTADDAEGTRIAQLLTERGDWQAEEALLNLLTRTDPGVRLAAIGALGAVGTGRAIDSLEPLTRGFFGNGPEKAAAKAALERIKVRRAASPVGRVSLADMGDVRGGLSLADAPHQEPIADPPEFEPVSS